MVAKGENNENKYDLVIIGGGPAGLSAAINAQIRNLDFVLFGSDFASPKLLQAPEVNNYPGFPSIKGEKLAEEFSSHVEKMGIKRKQARIDNIYDQGEQYALIAGDTTFIANSLILAVGVSNEKTLPGEKEKVGKGVSYCATCDGPLYRGKKVAALIYSKEGVEEISYLSEVAKKVYVIAVNELDVSLPQNIELITKKPASIKGDKKVGGLEFDDGSFLDVGGVFIFRKVTPPDSLLQGLETKEGHLKVNRSMETSKEGVFAAGDCTGLPYQIAKAMGEGQVAALNAASYIQKKG